jgi:hypothetical protein
MRAQLMKMTVVLLVAAAAAPLAANPPAVASEHWAFQPVRDVTPPLQMDDWSANLVDRFLVAKRDEQGLRPVGDADRPTLIRRVYFDLVGLPPTPTAIDAFVEDDAPDAYSRLVDRLLASPRYGERWGRYWLDLARYSDTAGDNADCPIPEMYRYRDYVIDAFNSDKPYDRFLCEQLAGDIMARTAPQELQQELKVATSFIAISRRFGTQPFQFHHLEIEDTIDTAGRAILAMTLKCARCHDHKFDPITNRDYYALYGFFESTQYPFTGSEATKKRTHLVPLEHSAEEYEKISKAYEAGINKVTDEIKTLRNPTLNPLQAQVDEFRVRIKEARRLGRPEEEVRAIEKEFQAVNAVLEADFDVLVARRNKLHDDHALVFETVAYAASEGKPVDAKIQLQGNPKELGEVVPRNAPVVLQTNGDLDIPAGTSGRLELAEWISSPRNPLTARVMVNRIWRYHFGRGLVETPSNFGVAGAVPTHPELLDWLAGQFIASGWSIKAMHRLLMSSRTYRLASESIDDNETTDPGNKTHWHTQRRQLDAEAIRDAMLAVSGDLDLTTAGPHPFPKLRTWDYSQHKPFVEVYPTNRRSVYLMTQRIQRHPYLAIFDGADTNQSTGERTESIVPQQALFLMNNPFVTERARGLARRLLENLDEQERIARAYRLAWGRPPDADDIEKASAYVTRYRGQLMAAGTQAAEVDAEAWTSFARLMLTANEFLYID